MNLKKIFLRPKGVKCPICQWEGAEFRDYDCKFGHVYKNAECPVCLSHPRHRSFYLYFKRILSRKRRCRFLHFAPEKCLTDFFKAYPNIEYLSVDARENAAMKTEDIENLSFADETFDVIFCCHVLEHVQDDKKAMAEIRRVVKTDGLAVIDVPINFYSEKTLEDPAIQSEQERTKAYWQFDHMRLYGCDFPARLRGAGFHVKVVRFNDSLGKRKRAYFGLENFPIYHCTKK